MSVLGMREAARTDRRGGSRTAPTIHSPIRHTARRKPVGHRLANKFRLTASTVWSMHTIDSEVFMFLTVDANDKRPLYQQIVDGVKELIARGDLREGTTLPSVRQVASDLGVNLNTIAVAYRRLQEEGFLSVRHGAGAVVSSRRARAVEEDELRQPLRTALTQLILAGKSREEIIAAVRQELEFIRQKGDSQ